MNEINDFDLKLISGGETNGEEPNTFSPSVSSSSPLMRLAQGGDKYLKIMFFIAYKTCLHSDQISLKVRYFSCQKCSAAF